MLKLPANPIELRAAIQRAIEFYQGNPAKNQNKLNEALAIALGFENYDQLAPLMVAPVKIDTYPIAFDYDGDQFLLINGVRIAADLAHNGVVVCSVYDREDRLSEIQRYLGEALHPEQIAVRGSSSIYAMQKDIDYLRSSQAEWVLGYMENSGFIAPDVDPQLFNDTCDAMLKAAAKHYSDQVGPLTKTGRQYTNCTAYYSGESVNAVFAGELVLLKEDWLGDDRLPIGMCVEKFVCTVPSGYMAAYAGSVGEYVPIYLNDE